MFQTYASALVLCAASIVLGRGICAAAGQEGWSWLSPAVGLAALTVVCKLAIGLPGRSTTAVVIVVVLLAAALVVGHRRGAGWPPAEALLVALLALLAVSTTFVANGRVGVLGVSFLDDTRLHLMWAESLRRPALTAFEPFSPGYPLGPHAVMATLAQGLGSDVDKTLTGFLLATPGLTAMTALGALRDVTAPRRWLGALLVAVGYFAVAWYVQSAFKEPELVLFFLAMLLAVEPARREGVTRPLRVGVPLAVLLAGTFYSYSYFGLVWPALTLAVWVGLELVLGRGWRRAGALRARLRSSWRILAIGGGVLLLALIPQIGAIHDFAGQLGSSPASGAIGKDQLANLAAPLKPWQALGVWLNTDFRFIPGDYTAARVWGVLGGGILTFGLVWALRRRDYVRPAAVLACAAIYVIVDQSQSPYVAAKALVIGSPLILLVGSRALLRSIDSGRWRSPLTWLAAGVTILFSFLALKSSYLQLRGGVVGPPQHFRELRALRPLLHGKPTLFLVYDDYFKWELLGLSVTDPPLPSPIGVMASAQKPWRDKQLLDFDSIDPGKLDLFSYVITTRSPALSTPPPNFVPAGGSASYAVWRRTGSTRPHRVLPESGRTGAVLDCSTPAGRRISREGGTARVRPAPVYSAPVKPLLPGLTTSVRLRLAPGAWDLSLPYAGAQGVAVRGPGFSYHLPPNLDRPGTLWYVGRIRSSGAPMTVTFTEDKPARIYSDTQFVAFQRLVASRAAPERTIPLRRACGRFVDWYTPAR